MEIKIITQRITSCDPSVVINSKTKTAKEIIEATFFYDFAKNNKNSEDKIIQSAIEDVDSIIAFFESVKKQIKPLVKNTTY